MFEIADRDVNLTKLSGELATLNLPGFRGVSRTTRRGGQTVARHIRVKCGDCTAEQIAAAEQVVAAHDPSELPPRDAEEALYRKVRDGDSLTSADRDAILELVIQRKWV